MAKLANIIIMGPPGAGKGTQSEKIVAALSIPHISTGDMFREAISKGTKLGKDAQQYINKGELVPDDVTIGLVKERLSRPDCENGYLLDGFPRTLNQAYALKEMLKEIHRPIDVALNIDVEKNALIDRISGRRVCPKCGNSYHLQFKKPLVDGLCDSCNSELIQRKDDTPESLKVRLDAYENQTKPLIDYYKGEGVLYSVDGLQDINKVFEDILSVLKGEKR